MPSQPNGILAREGAQDRLDRRAADAVEAVAAGDHVAVEPMLARRRARSARTARRRSNPCTLTSSTSKSSGSPLVEPRRDQVLDDLGLAVDHDAAPAGQLAHRDVVPLAVELQVDAAVDDPLAVQPLGDARLARAARPSPARARRRGCAPRRSRGCGPRARPTRSRPGGAARARVSPAGPAPTIATCVREPRHDSRRAPPARSRTRGSPPGRRSRSPPAAAPP